MARIESHDWTNKHILVAELSKTRHRYTLDGEIVPGVTSIKKAYPPSEGLIQYMIKQGIEEYKTGAKLKRAAGIGTIMHDYAHTKRLGLPFDVAQVEKSPDKEKLLHRFSLIDKWVGTQTDKVILAEKSVASVRYKYCGTFDVLVEREGKLILQDYKSSKGFYEDQFIQLAFYKQALHEWDNITVDGLEVIRFADDTDKPAQFLVDSPLAIADFLDTALRLRETHNFQKKWATYFKKINYGSTNSVAA